MGSLTVQLSHEEVGTRLGSLFVSVGYRSAYPRPEVSAILAFFRFFDKRDVREQRESGIGKAALQRWACVNRKYLVAWQRAEVLKDFYEWYFAK